MFKLKTSLFFILYILASFSFIQAKSNEIVAVETRYGFDENSSYEAILQAISLAYADIKADPADKEAFAVTILAPQYLNTGDQTRLLLDFNLQQADSRVRRVALKKIVESLASGHAIDSELALSLCNRICLNFSDLQEKDKIERDIVNYSSEILLHLGDPRGLVSMFANKQYIKNIMRTDGWDMDSSAQVFFELSGEYSEKANPNSADRRKTVFYSMLHARKSSGQQLLPEDIELELSSFFE